MKKYKGMKNTKEENRLDNEKINGIPEEETEAVAEVQEEETAEETVETAEVISENEESEETEVEESAEKSEETEEIDEDNLCCLCGENQKEEGSDYCAECEATIHARKIPFLGWIAGLAAVCFSVFAMGIGMLVSAPALQIARGDANASNNCWYSAYNEYQGVSEIVNEVHQILGKKSPFVQTGSTLNIKIIEAVAESYSPLEAVTVAQSLLGENALTEYSALKKYDTIRKDYVAAYEALMGAIEKMTAGEAEKEETYAAFEAVRGQDGVKDIYLNYFLYNAAAYYNDSTEAQIKYLDMVEKCADESGENFDWLFYQDYADLLYNAGKTEEAKKYLNALTDGDKSKFGAYALKMKIAIAEKNMDEANKILAEFKNNNEGYDTAYVLEATLLRSSGEYDRTKALLEEALEEYGNVPELHRQLALIYLLEEDYDAAFEQAFEADSNAYYLYYYMGDSSSYTPELNNTLYLCTYLCKEYGNATSDNAVYIDEILKSFSETDLSEQVISVTKGEKTVKQVLTEGVCDLA